ncbi:hypothetical protein HYPSUDRAFT_70872 [Hypholoma sublateritium FD-334 SS-4]|uniref:MARVEL domain-containing protein n=1 Tax=Hypholoma sublateritium (strain FD-334 SS-4) TaxID=945553 RepID=A0A0D2PA69_HYPSF|nr:hypothetical protein HYPSUDRAFT_70872 [Hypholoma sublateritium FD-334 SS-4]
MLSSVGKKKITAQVAFLVVDIIVLALAARVNAFNEFFYAADLFPLALAIVSLVVGVSLLALDLALADAYTARPQAEIAVFGVLAVLWLAFSAFSTARWAGVPLQCSAIPSQFADARTWCADLQALKAFVWIEFLMCLGIALFTLRYAIAQRARGNTHIFAGPLSRYVPRAPPAAGTFGYRGSEFLQFEKPF